MVGEKIRVLREKFGISSHDMAERLGHLGVISQPDAEINRRALKSATAEEHICQSRLSRTFIQRSLICYESGKISKAKLAGVLNVNLAELTAS